MDIVTYLLWPNPGNVTYSSPKVLALLLVCGFLVVLAFVLRFWRKRLKNPVTKRLSKSWPTACAWFGIIGLVMVVSRVEQISFLSMRLLWFFWAAALLFYLFIQVRIFRMRHYEQLPKEKKEEDPREKYLPKKKKR